jgi:hypothetical protein
MGYEKERQIQQWEQGWSFSDRDICYLCLSEPTLREFVKDRADRTNCDFCNRQHRKNVAVEFNSVMELIGDAIRQYYSIASDTLSYDREDERYMGSTYDTCDVLDDLGWPSDNESVVEEIVDCLGHETWCDRHPYSLDGVERYDSSWEQFCETVKHKVRYFFSNVEEDKYSETIPVPDMLKTIKELTERADMIVTLDPAQPYYRVRHHAKDNPCATWRELGSPPPDRAMASRMSAAGISVFYAGLDMDTARAETTLRSKPGWMFTGAQWTSTRPLRVLDLSRRPELPSVYATARYDRDDLVFLRNFVESVSQPVIPDDRVHIDYVPTQIVTEFFRHSRAEGEQKIDGIVYPSAQCKGRSIVIFASNDDINPRPFEWPRDVPPLLVLSEDSIQRVRKYRRVQKRRRR